MADENVNADLEPTPAETGETQESALDAAAAKVRAQREERIPHSVLEDKAVENSMRELVVEIPRAEWDSRVDGMFKEWQKSAAIEGFRRGKAPMALLKKRFMREASGEVLEKLVPPIVRQYEEESSHTLYGVPMVTEFKPEETGQPVRVTLRVEVKPEINAAEYTGIEVEVPELRIPPDSVDRNIENLRQQSATYEEVDRGIEGHDAAVLDVKVVDTKGRTVAQETNKLFEHLHDAFPAEVLAELQGKKAGDTVETSAPSRQRVGQQDRYTLAVKSVKALKVPDLDDEFAKDMGFDDLAALRASYEERTRKYVEQANSDEAFEAIVAKLVEAHNFEVPPTLHERVKADMMRSDMNFMYSTGSMPARAAGRSSEEYRSEVEKDAHMRVKGLLLVDAIGLKEKIEATEDDINEALEERGREQGRKGVAIRAALEKRREFEQFVEQVRFAKVRKFLLENNKVKFVEPPPPPAPEAAPAE